MRFERSGSGPVPVVCVHGWGCEGSQFRAMSALLGPGYEIYRPDLPGHGRTPLDGFRPGFESYADEIVGFVRARNLDRPVLIGHSMGGVLSLIAASTGRIHPRAVVNLDGSLPMSVATLEGQRTIRSWLDLPDFRARLAGLLTESFFEPAERDDRCRAIVNGICAAPDAVLQFLPEQIDQLRPEVTLAKIAAPTLYVGSARPRFDAPRAEAIAPGLHFEQIPDVGHFLPVYAPDRVAARVRAFVRT